MAILGAVGGTTSPIALTGILVTDLTADMEGLAGIAQPVFLGVSLANLICAVVVYIVFGGYKLKGESDIKEKLPAFTKNQIICIAALLVMVVSVVGFKDGLLQYCDCIKTGGGQPRFITVSPWGTVIAANETTDLITEFSLDGQTGKFSPTGWSLESESPVCLIFKS